jgi:hypothetical protein
MPFHFIPALEGIKHILKILVLKSLAMAAKLSIQPSRNLKPPSTSEMHTRRCMIPNAKQPSAMHPAVGNHYCPDCARLKPSGHRGSFLLSDPREAEMEIERITV